MLLSELAHDRKGSGETVVLIHGIGHRRQAWYPVFETLAESYDVIAVDLAGFGESAPYPRGAPYTMDNACSDLAANFELWGVERPHVVGNSLGGAIALELGARKLVSSVTALSPAGFFGRVDRYQALGILGGLKSLSRLPDPVLKQVARHKAGKLIVGGTLYAHPFRHDEETTYGDSVGLKRGPAFWPVARQGIGYRFREEVRVPTTVAWGTKDLILPYRQAKRAAEQLPKAEHVALEGAGHVPMVDAPAEVVALIGETVAQGASRRHSAAARRLSPNRTSRAAG